MQNISEAIVGALPIAIPPTPAEQSAIAAFLDHETAKIDALVAEQERLIALLKEKRQAVISHAVTKGMNPNAPMKDSGVEWLGQVPTHWTRQRLQDRCEFRSGKAHEPHFDDEGQFICVTARFISSAGADGRHCSVNLTPANFHDILMVMSDLPNGRALARTYLVRDHRSYAVNQRVCIITSCVDDPRFLAYLLNRYPGLLCHDDGMNQTHLSNDDFRKLSLAVPPIKEQVSIADFLDNACRLADNLIAEAAPAITLLRERRAALISAAVTGKIDVRGFVPLKQHAA